VTTVNSNLSYSASYTLLLALFFTFVAERYVNTRLLRSHFCLSVTCVYRLNSGFSRNLYQLGVGQRHGLLCKIHKNIHICFGFFKRELAFIWTYMSIATTFVLTYSVRMVGWSNYSSVVIYHDTYSTVCALTWPGCWRIPFGDSAANRPPVDDPQLVKRVNV